MPAQERNYSLEEEVKGLQAKLDDYQRREREEAEQDLLAASIWGHPVNKQPDGSWDAKSSSLFDPRPLTIGKVVTEMGYKRTPQQVRRICQLVRRAYTASYNRAPVPKVFYNADGSLNAISCYTEDDRLLIQLVITEYGEPLDPPTVNPLS